MIIQGGPRGRSARELWGFPSMGVFRASARLVRMPAVVVAAGSLVLVGGSAQAVTGSQIAAIAYAQLGKGCAGNGWQCHPDEWCADFAGWVWSQAGINTVGDQLPAGRVPYARSALSTGPWTVLGDAMPQGASWATPDGYWAPDFSKLPDGHYLMYFSALDSAIRKRYIGAAVASTPAGPFVSEGGQRTGRRRDRPVRLHRFR